MSYRNLTKIQELISSKASIPIRFVEMGKFLTPILYPEAKRHLTYDRDIRKHIYPLITEMKSDYQRVFGWIKANPSEPGIAAATESVYISNEYLDKSRARHDISSPEGFASFLKSISNTGIKTIIIKGKKGIGKTFNLNYIFNKYTRDFYRDYQLVWYRADSTKIFDTNMTEKEAGSKHYISLKDYLCIQICYVSYKYKSENPVWNDFFSNKDPIVQEIIVDICGGIDGEYDRDSKKIINDFIDILNRLGKTDNSELEKEDIIRIMSDKRRILTFELLSEAILTYLDLRDFRTMFIIDGIDNLDVYNYQEIYLNFIRELHDFSHITDNNKHEHDALHVVVMRNETYDDLLRLKQDFWNGPHYSEFSVNKISLTKMINKKKDVAIKNEVPWFRFFKNRVKINTGLREILQEDESFPLRNIKEFDDTFDRFLTDYLDSVGKVFREITSDTEIEINNVDDVITYIFNDNLRSFVSNLLNTYLYYMLFIVKRNVVDTRIKDYLISEGTLLNGHLWLDTSLVTEPINDPIPNIFWFKYNEARGNWHGLCMLRMLQFLSKDLRAEKTEIIDFLEVIGYENSIVNERFNKAIGFGLIDSRFDIDSKIVDFGLTEKGKLFIEYPFLDINQFYYMSLDTPLCVEEHDNLAKHFHDYGGDLYWKNYTEAAIYFSLNLIRHIITQVKKEDSVIPEKYKDACRITPQFPGLLVKGITDHIRNLYAIYQVTRVNDIISYIEKINE